MEDNIRERSLFLSKTLHIPKQQAWAILEGHLIPEQNILKMIAKELDIDLSKFLEK